nr:MAG TPA: hypothetical protein [Caudoviricetes sp.]
MIEIKAVPGKLIMLGKQGENLAREVIFDVSGVRAEFGDGTFRLSAKRPGEADAYPATVTETGDTVVWALTGADMQNAGHGQCELAYYADETRYKTWTYDTAVAKSLTGSPKTDPYDEFLDEVNRLAAEAAISQREAKNSENAAKNSEENAKASETAAKTSEDNAAAYAQAALAAETKSKQNAEYAASAATASGQYAQNAATSATNAASSASAAETHEKGAKDAAAAAAKSAEGLADAVKRAEDAATSAQDNAGKTVADREAVAEMKTAAETAQGNAETSATAAAGSATSAGESAVAAETSKTGAAEIKAQIDEIKAGIDVTKGEIDQAKTEIDQTKTDTLAAQTAAETAAATATEKAAEIADSAAQIATNAENIGKNATNIETNAEDIDLLRRENTELRAKTDALWKLSEGKSYDFVEDSAEAYNKDVPTGCKFAQIEKIGGKTAVWNQCAKVTSSSAANNGITRTVDGGIISLSGTLAERSYFNWDPTGSEMTIIDHVYLFGKHVIANPADISFYYGQFNRDSFKDLTTSSDSAKIAKMTKELAANENGHGLGGMTAGTDLTGIKLQVFDIDLTRLFGSGNEPTTTSDPRIAEIIAYAEKHPEYNAGELVSAGVEDVKVQGTNSLDTYPIPDAVKALPGYGWSAGSICNEIVRRADGWDYVQRVERYVADNPDKWRLGNGNIRKFFTTNVEKPALKLAGSNTFRIVCDRLTYVNYSYAEASKWPYTISFQSNAATLAAVFTDTDTDSLDTWQAWLQSLIDAGTPLTVYYAVATPITTDITDLMTGALPLVATEPGGTITMHHALADGGLPLDVPNTVKYIRDLKEVVSSGTE